MRAKDEDADPVIEEMRSITGVEISILFREMDKGYRVSLRSRGKVNVGKLAEGFGGGGHYDSAGFQIAGSWRSIKAVLAAAARAI